jgi:transcriptional regulator with GAF, ATPase, and Fis domain
MEMTATSVDTAVIGARIDRLSNHLLSAAVSRGPDTIDASIANVLQQIGEALGADYAILESVSDDAKSESRRAWIRRGATADREPAVSIRVAVAPGCTFTLSVGIPEWGSPLPTEVVDGLRALAHVMVLIVHRDQQMHELERVKCELAHPLVAFPPRGFRETWDSEDFEDVIGDSPALRIAMARVHEVAPTGASVVILGETGTGKELFARAVHNRSTRRERPFVRVNCAALPSTLIETELFGHVRGAFTGAVATRQGRFEVADGGTLFLDEIGDLPADVQAKLLRVLQEGEFERVGSSQSRKVDVRIVAATHYDLEQAMNEGRFRADLYYRLSVFPIVLPPLRDRTEDIPRLTWYFVNRRQRALNRKFTNIPASVFADLQQRPWPGNVRELENVIERAMIHSVGDTLQLDETPGLQSATRRDAGTLLDMERQYVEDALRRCRWRINGRGNAADVLGLHPNTLRNRMKKFGIHRPNGPMPMRQGRRNLGAITPEERSHHRR